MLVEPINWFLESEACYVQNILFFHILLVSLFCFLVSIIPLEWLLLGNQ